MPTLESRLLHLEKRRPRRPSPTASSFDPTRLTFAEQIELDDLLSHFAPSPGEPWPLDRMTDAQLERCYGLSRKAEGHPPSPAYVGMPHRDPGIGPCRCADCDAEPTRTDDDGRPDAAA